MNDEPRAHHDGGETQAPPIPPGHARRGLGLARGRFSSCGPASSGSEATVPRHGKPAGWPVLPLGRTSDPGGPDSTVRARRAFFFERQGSPGKTGRGETPAASVPARSAGLSSGASRSIDPGENDGRYPTTLDRVGPGHGESAEGLRRTSGGGVPGPRGAHSSRWCGPPAGGALTAHRSSGLPSAQRTGAGFGQDGKTPP
jgi:hypothetical protein